VPLRIHAANSGLTMCTGAHKEGESVLGRPLDSVQRNQKWMVVLDPLGSGHHLIVDEVSNLCVGIGRNVPDPSVDPFSASVIYTDATDRGAILTLQAQGELNNQYQLWDFLPPTGGSGNAAFIQSPETGYVIELQSHSSPLVVNPRRISNDDFQLWMANDYETGEESPFPVLPMVPSVGQLQGNVNYFLLPPSQGDNLIGLAVTVDVIEDIQVNGDAFSLQINCNTPYLGPYGSDTEDFDRQAQWMQFGMFMQNNELVLFNDIWQGSYAYAGTELSENAAMPSPPFLQLKNNKIEAGTRIIMNLCTDHTDFAIGVTGLALDIKGVPIGPPVYWPTLGQPTAGTMYTKGQGPKVDGGVLHQKAMAPIGAVQIVIGAPAGIREVQFTSGMGTITVTASPGILPPEQTLSFPLPNGGTAAVPNPSGIATFESSNMLYDLLPSVTARLLAQPFGAPRVKADPCAAYWDAVVFTLELIGDQPPEPPDSPPSATLARLLVRLVAEEAALHACQMANGEPTATPSAPIPK
jgi:hypothetical protein